MHITKKRTDIILKALQEKGDWDYATHYGEPGYQNPEVGILFADWNPVSRRICDYLEEAGYELEWCDEWYVDYDNDKAWRTSPTSYDWQCSIRYTEHGVLTPDDSLEDWIDEIAMTDWSQPTGTVPSWITPNDLEERGFIKYNGDFETGWHPGQTDDAHVIAVLLFETIPDIERVLFRIGESSQFYTVWEAYYWRDAGSFDDSMDGDFDSAMASAGHGTDEDYGGIQDE